MLFASYVTALMFVCAFDSNAAFQTREAVNDTSGDEGKGPVDLANYVISTLGNLSEEKSGAEVKADLEQIVQLSSDLLDDTDEDDQKVPGPTNDDKVSNKTAIETAVKLDDELYLLSSHARDLLKAFEDRLDDETVLNIIAIKQRASSIIRIIDESGIDFISYQDPFETAQGGRERRRNKCLGFSTKNVCIGWRY